MLIGALMHAVVFGNVTALIRVSSIQASDSYPAAESNKSETNQRTNLMLGYVCAAI